MKEEQKKELNDLFIEASKLCGRGLVNLSVFEILHLSSILIKIGYKITSESIKEIEIEKAQK